jgi:hypothetical protein
MAMANKFKVSEICIEENEFGRGYTRYGLPLPLNPISRKGVVLTLAAGLAADAVYLKCSGVDDGELPWGYHNDREQAEEHLRELGEDGGFDAYLAVAGRFFERKDVWCHVDFLARALLEVGKIDNREIMGQVFTKVPSVSDEEFKLIEYALAAVFDLNKNFQGR